MRVIAACVAGLVLCSAYPIAAKGQSSQPQPVEEPNWATVRPRIEQFILSRLVDPDSAKIGWTNGFHWGFHQPPFHGKIWGWIGCSSVNAKNKLGGYTGPKSMLLIWDDGVVFSDSDENYIFPNVDKYCQRSGVAPVQAVFREPLHDKTISGSVADELSKLAGLRDKGVITDSEFQSQKNKLLRN